MVVPGYALVRRLSSGGGPTEVWSAAPAGGGDLVALKILGPGLPDDQRLRFANEGALLRELGGQHGLIGCLGVVAVPPCLVLELMPGGNLRDRIDQSRLSKAEVVRLGVATAGALQWLHHHGVIHRDLKSSNILLAADGSSRVADLSVAARGNPPRGLPEGWVEESVGTLGYAAPELLRDAATATPLVDIYGLGAVLYESLTGRLPLMMVGDEDENQLRARIRAGARPVPLEPGAGADRWLTEVIIRAIDPDPAARFQSAGQFAEALNRQPLSEA